jgi:CRP-like cAMP-binding protein
VNAASAPRNHLLRALLEDAGAPVAGGMEIFGHAAEGSVLQASDVPVTAAYFPERAVVALVLIDDAGRQVEITTVGNEGMVGLPLVLGTTQQIGCAVVQISGDIARVPAPVLTKALDANARVREVFLTYVHAFMADLIRSRHCVRQHTVEQRCARWLLVTHDRLGSDIVPVTPDRLRDALRVSRPGLMSVFRHWDSTGVIRYDRRRITIVERAALEDVACACYAKSRT